MERPENTTEAPTRNLTSVFPKISMYELSAVTALNLLILIGIIFGNGLVIAAFIVSRKLRFITNKMILGLPISDLLVGLVSVPLWIYITLKSARKEHYSTELYQFYITFDIFVGSASILQLTTISIERCHAIVRPLRHRTLRKKTFRVLMACPWFVAAFIASLQPLQYQRWQKVYTLLMVSTCFLLPLLVISIAYICIFVFARSKKSARRRLLRNTSKRREFKKEIRLSVTLALITFLFVIAWLPLFVLTIIATYYPSYLPSLINTDRLLKFAKCMHYSNSSLNPFLYTLRNHTMRKTTRLILSKLLCGHFKLPKQSGLSLQLRSTYSMYKTDSVTQKTRNSRRATVSI